jgi:hypothetical protein
MIWLEENMRGATITVFLCVLGLHQHAGAAPGLKWKYDGHRNLAAAAAEAKRTGQRLLVGLAGSPT